MLLCTLGALRREFTMCMRMSAVEVGAVRVARAARIGVYHLWVAARGKDFLHVAELVGAAMFSASEGQEKVDEPYACVRD